MNAAGDEAVQTSHALRVMLDWVEGVHVADEELAQGAGGGGGGGGRGK